MIEYLKQKLSIRRGFITAVIVLVLCNIAFITAYYKVYFSSEVNRNYQKITEELKQGIKIIKEECSTKKDYQTCLNDYSNQNNNIITLTDEQTNLVYKSSNYGQKGYFITSSDLIDLENKTYLISISKEQQSFNIHLVASFIIFDISIVVILSITGLIGANLKILSPITSLSKDMSNYKLGILPKKRKVRGEIDSLQNDFVDLVNNLEEEKQKQNRMIASISHDIKTPLTSILGYSERLIMSKNLSSATKEKYAQTIFNKSIVMKEIIEEFDNYLSCNIKDNNKVSKISIKTLVDYLNNYYKTDLKEKDITLKIKSTCYNSYLLVDFAKLKRVFSNIITNSIRQLNKDKKLIKINITKKEPFIIFEIADNGCGVKDVKKIFEPLYTTDPSRKISGLGLSICEEIITSHDGTIKAVNNEMGGLSIIFTLKEYEEDYERTNSL